jgi:hypothetical protein
MNVMNIFNISLNLFSIALNTRLFNATKKLYSMGPFKKSNEILNKAKELENQMLSMNIVNFLF